MTISSNEAHIDQGYVQIGWWQKPNPCLPLGTLVQSSVLYNVLKNFINRRTKCRWCIHRIHHSQNKAISNLWCSEANTHARVYLGSRPLHCTTGKWETKFSSASSRCYLKTSSHTGRSRLTETNQIRTWNLKSYCPQWHLWLQTIFLGFQLQALWRAFSSQSTDL